MCRQPGLLLRMNAGMVATGNRPWGIAVKILFRRQEPHCVLPAMMEAMDVNSSGKLLLSIIELGGYPNFAPLYRELGYEVAVETRMRKAISFLKRRTPDVIVAEFNFQSDFRDRTSTLESLLAVVQRMPRIRVIVFYEQEYLPQFEVLRSRLPVHHALAFPVDEAGVRACLQAADNRN
jgi:hypothetical protein